MGLVIFLLAFNGLVVFLAMRLARKTWSNLPDRFAQRNTLISDYFLGVK